MKEYLGKNLTCIYLDQFAASIMFDDPTDTPWMEISKVLMKKHAQGKIICPLPMEHLLESSNKTPERAFRVDNQFHLLSNGLAFLPEAIVAANYMISVVRGIKIRGSDMCGLLKYDSTLSQPGAFEGFKDKHRVLTTQVDEVAIGQNEIRDLLRKKKFSWKVLEPLYQAVKLMQVNEFLGRLNELILRGKIITRGMSLAGWEVPHWADMLLQILLRQHKLNRQEALILQKIISTSGFEKIPPLDIRCSLTALITAESKNESVNDQIDIMRLSGGLAVSDLLFTDKQRKSELEKTGLDLKYSTKVYSASPKDLVKFLKELESL